MTDYAKIIHALIAEKVEFIIIGGAAATAYGSSRLTEDLDIVYSRSRDNIQRLFRALEPLKPGLRGAPDNLPFRWDEKTLRNGLNFTLSTSAGSLDLFGEIIGGPTFEDLVADSLFLNMFGSQCLCLSLPRLIEVKQAMGRPKDIEVVAELKVILEEQNRQ
jgi:predicted nucleotidyltransferase